MMQATLEQNKPAISIIHTIPTWVVHAIILLALALGMFVTASMASSAAAAEAAAAGEESDFELEDVYGTWAWIILVATFAETAFFGVRRHMTFASTMQISLIILLSVSFLFMTQQVERDVYNVGVFSLIIFTLIQIAFGNISPQANLRQSFVGVVITAVILAAVVAFSIWLAPYLIQLGR